MARAFTPQPQGVDHHPLAAGTHGAYTDEGMARPS